MRKVTISFEFSPSKPFRDVRNSTGFATVVRQPRTIVAQYSSAIQKFNFTANQRPPKNIFSTQKLTKPKEHLSTFILRYISQTTAIPNRQFCITTTKRENLTTRSTDVDINDSETSFRVIDEEEEENDRAFTINPSLQEKDTSHIIPYTRSLKQYFIKLSPKQLEEYRKKIFNRQFQDVVSDIEQKRGNLQDTASFVIHRLVKSEYHYEAHLFLSYLYSRKICEVEIPVIVELLNGLILIQKFGFAEELFDLSKNQLQGSLIYYSLLIKLYCKSAKLELIKKTLDEMKSKNIQPNHIIYSTLIEAYSQSGMVDECLRLIEEMKKENLELTIYIYNSLFYCYKVLKMREKAEELFLAISEGQIPGVQPDKATFNIMLQLYFTEKRVDEAKQFFEYIRNTYADLLDCSSYNLMINEFYRMQQTDEAAKILELLISSELQMDRITFIPIIKDCVLKKDMKSAESTFQYMVSLGIKPNVSILNLLISGFFEEGNVDKATQCYMIFFDEGIRLEKSVYPQFLSELIIRPGYICSYIDYFKNLMNDPELGRKLGTAVFNILISAAHQHMNDPKLALSIFHSMKERGARPNNMTYSCMIPIFLDISDYSNAIACFEQIEPSSIQIRTYEAILVAYASLNQIDKFTNILTYLEKKKWKISFQVTSRITEAFFNNPTELENWKNYLSITQFKPSHLRKKNNY